MSNETFDTHKYAKQLLESGLPAAAVDVLAETTGNIMREVASVAAKADTQEIRAGATTTRLEAMIGRLDDKIERVNDKIDRVAAEIKADMMKWAIGIVFAQAGLLGAILKFFS